jgi:hypothetical protein
LKGKTDGAWLWLEFGLSPWENDSAYFGASLAAIARGDYDFYIVTWAKAAAEYRKPLFLRFAHEMNDP